MWKTLPLVSDVIAAHLPAEEQNALVRKIYCAMSGGHYNEEFAHEDVGKMYYIDRKGARHNAPYWTEPEVYEVYQSVKNDIPGYNRWDWLVTFEMVASDNWCLINEWFPDIDKQEIAEKVTQMSLNWLKDDDNPYGSEKIWRYLNK
jgi:hypothetical protein